MPAAADQFPLYVTWVVETYYDDDGDCVASGGNAEEGIYWLLEQGSEGGFVVALKDGEDKTGAAESLHGGGENGCGTCRVQVQAND